MNQKRIFWVILLFVIASLDLCMIQNIELHYGSGRDTQDTVLLQPDGEAVEILRAFELPTEDYDKLEKDGQELLLAYLYCKSTDEKKLQDWCSREKAAAPDLYGEYLAIMKKLLSDAVYFPVPESMNDLDATVSYENSWQYERTYGGTRGHEGCDLMADIQQRGYYPVLSVSDGVVEKTGWLPKGGYRIGVRSPAGVYFYYAHLAEYDESIKEGMQVTAGQMLGYMGDTGYSEVEGTTGNFPVHLHFGIYLNDADGVETSYNPYYLLRILEKNKLKYVYKR